MQNEALNILTKLEVKYKRSFDEKVWPFQTVTTEQQIYVDHPSFMLAIEEYETAPRYNKLLWRTIRLLAVMSAIRHVITVDETDIPNIEFASTPRLIAKRTA